MADYDLLFVDVETTGLDPYEHALLELTAIRTTWDTTQVLAKLSTKVIPHRLDNASPEALRINGFNEADWMQALEERDALNGMLNTTVLPFGRYIIVGHNVFFDRDFLMVAMRRHGLRLDPAPRYSVDSCCWSLMLKQRSLIKSMSLRDFCSYLGVSNDGEHTSLRDVERLIECYRKTLGLAGHKPLFGMHEEIESLEDQLSDAWRETT